MKSRQKMWRVVPLLAISLGACSEGPLNTSTRDAAPADLMPRYYLVGPSGTRALDGKGQKLLPRFGVSIVEERFWGAQKVGRTRLGRLLPMRDLRPADPSDFSGVVVQGGRLAVAWTLRARTPVYARPKPTGKPLTRLPRLQQVSLADAATGNGFYPIRAADGTGWIAAEHLAVPTRAVRPLEVAHTELWIDVDLASQTLVVYQGDQPVFATLISGGVGVPGTTFATPLGVHRIRAKLRFATMDNLEHSGVVPYSYEDVPYTQYIGGVALHGVFWHDRFGTPMSHGCINLSLDDARRVFEHTSPHLLPGVDQGASSQTQPGTVVRVR